MALPWVGGGAAVGEGGLLASNPVGWVIAAGLGGVAAGTWINNTFGDRIASDVDWVFGPAMPDPNTMFSKGGKSQGRNWATEQAKSEAQGSGKDPCDILDDMLASAKAAGNTAKAADIVQAQKFMDCRNKNKRKNKYRCEG